MDYVEHPLHRSRQLWDHVRSSQRIAAGTTLADELRSLLVAAKVNVEIVNGLVVPHEGGVPQ